MADEMALPAQEFVNATYGTRIGMTVEEDEQTSWNAMHSLTRAPQRESGISSPSNSFGPGTMSASEADTEKALVRCQGTTADAKTEERKRRGLYRTFAKYHAPMREHA
ncbi:hypothetical protein [Streptomyces sp. LN245]|uniref:hypothetical protein n=1 Tax=Streptomyces sp. LN245 TaxID=3112975 RepID=UPI0037130D7D